ncbi:MAG TPA: hypothetical protein DCM23_00135 [Firmicutes bacterium]|nr:hypothetical protein [Bacillota bacterium]
MSLFDKLLTYYQIDLSTYRHMRRPLTYGDLPLSSSFPDLEKITKRIKLALSKREKIMVYGDYDADGVLATSILVDAFKKLNFEVGYYIPNRYQDGYGIHADKVEEIAAKGYSLIITVDNGVNAHEAINKAYDHGIEVIITDHHEILTDIPRNGGILHPFIQAQPYPMCGAVMAFILSRALLDHVEPYHLALATIATISDMMPLLEVNRDLVRLGFDALNQGKYLPIARLTSNGGIIDEQIISMEITPSINAIGRLVENSQINRLVKYFTSSDEAETKTLASWIKEMNKKRRALMNSAFLELPVVEENAKAIVYLSNELEGLIGLLANKLVNEYDVPSVVFTPDESNPAHLIGSARTPLGYDLIAAFSSLEPHMLRGGGHSNAGGLTIEVAKFEAFKQGFINYFSSNGSASIAPKVIDLEISEISWDTLELINTFAPFGQNYKAPVFMIKNIKVSSLSFIKDDRFLATPLGLDRKLLSFNISREEVANYNHIHLIGTLKQQTYRYKRELVFFASGFIHE